MPTGSKDQRVASIALFCVSAVLGDYIDDFLLLLQRRFLMSRVLSSFTIDENGGRRTDGSVIEIEKEKQNLTNSSDASVFEKMFFLFIFFHHRNCVGFSPFIVRSAPLRWIPSGSFYPYEIDHILNGVRENRLQTVEKTAITGDLPDSRALRDRRAVNIVPRRRHSLDLRKLRTRLSIRRPTGGKLVEGQLSRLLVDRFPIFRIGRI